MQIHQAFPTPIMEAQLDSLLLQQCLAVARSTLPEDRVLREWSIKRPWCTDDTLHTLFQWRSISERILTAADHMLDAQGVIRQAIGISSMWVNAQYQHTNHQAHIHSNSYLSGVIYLQVPEHSQYIQFYDPRPAALVIRPQQQVDTETAQFTPCAGKFLMWPSWLLHSTNSSTHSELDQPRISISFNVMLKGHVGGHSAKMEVR